MSLLLELNGDLPEFFPNDERRIRIFTCRRKQCSRKPGSIRALREVRKHKDEAPQPTKRKDEPQKSEPQKKPADLGATLFGAKSHASNGSNINPFAMSTQASSTPSNPFSSQPPLSTLAAKPPQPPEEPPTETFASKLRLSSPDPPSAADPPTEPWPPESAFPPPFLHLHLEADYETLAPQTTDLLTDATSSTIQYIAEGEDPGNGLEKDAFESSLDKTFLRFSDRLAQNPEQVLRYEWKGTPLLYSSTDAVGKRLAPAVAKTKVGDGMPRCEGCGAERVFELQLVPGAIAALEEDEVELEEGMEWGTIIVGVCGRNCGGELGGVVFREEWCGMQWEERG
jgi:pre-rRNA-processing protein TSR4